MKNHLHRWVIEALSFMALGLFGSLIIGLILETIGNQTLIPQIDLSFYQKLVRSQCQLPVLLLG